MQKSRNAFILFPNQLFEDVQIIKSSGCQDILLVEEPIYYFDKVYKPFKPHKMKLAFLRACMKAYFDLHLKKKLPKCNIYYIEYSKIVGEEEYNSVLTAYNSISYYDPIDVELVRKMQKIVKKSNKDETVYESPDLLIDMKALSQYYTKYDKTPKHASFYEFIKKELQLLDGVKNLDKDNRSPPPSTEPNVYSFHGQQSLKPYYEEAISYVNKTFADHYGDCTELSMYPITHKESNKAFQQFLVHSLQNFGKYEDAVMLNDPFMYHSIISPMLNVGLLTPKQVLTLTMHHHQTHKNIPLSSLEGFVRQVIGWRSFMQSLYIFKGPEHLMTNLPCNNKKFKDMKAWYNGTTGIVPIDAEIKKVLRYGYAHHIVRLMIFMNFFILCELHPYEIYKWFMEVVSIDAYSWVMISNIYTMGYFHPRVMSKPYISTSNYIVKMTNYKRDGHWDKIWDALYHDFLRIKPTTFTFFYKRTYRANSEMQKLAQDFKKLHFVERKD